ncbi:hypothetical protein J2Y69_002265 [Microbacterium resistens]|uniref:Uncharacterized protein n=1 Tax=Microbacterium resistens TaxID=156977 RepID=A0ABU1SDG5_9MICO|nr:hypothetical protein [Microbacterium resistens]MDR6867661.1 hypothetical protein [Microbacterium resistens]
MTDRERLIEEARTAMAKAWSSTASWSDSWNAMAKAAFAVFEEAHTPTDDEREALGIVVANFISPAGYEVAELDYILADRILAAGFRRPAAPEPVDSSESRIGLNAGASGSSGVAPTDDKREVHRRVIDLWFATWRDIGKVSPALEVAIDSLEGMVSDALDAGFRRSEVPEPSAAPAMDEKAPEPQGACPQCRRTDGQHKLGCGERFDPEVHDELTRERDHHGIDPKPQGESSDAQVLAAFNAFFGLEVDHVSEGTATRMRAALRAAASVTEQGENR